MFVIRNNNLFITIALGLMVLAAATVVARGLNYGVDFTGGSIIDVRFEDRPERSVVEDVVREEVGETPFSVQSIEETGYVIRTPYLEEGEQGQLVSALGSETLGGSVERVSSVGPSVGSELRQKAFIALAVVFAAIVVFIAYAFRRVSNPVSSWTYGLVALVALTFDVLIPVGVFALLGFTVDILFVTALLAILGYSINDSIVVFDRIRENLLVNQEKKKKKRQPFETVVGKSLNHTFTRSINTSLTTLFAVLAVYFLGGETTREFALTLAVGVAAGTYSSIFLASPVLVSIQRWRAKRATN